MVRLVTYARRLNRINEPMTEYERFGQSRRMPKWFAKLARLRGRILKVDGDFWFAEERIERG